MLKSTLAASSLFYGTVTAFRALSVFGLLEGKGGRTFNGYSASSELLAACYSLLREPV